MPSDDVLKELFEWYDHKLPCYIGSKLRSDAKAEFAIKWRKFIAPNQVKKECYTMRLSDVDKALATAFECEAQAIIMNYEGKKKKLAQQMRVQPATIIPQQKD